MKPFKIYKNDGFTLMEILVALVLVGIIAMGIMPGITNALKVIYQSGEKSQDIFQSQSYMQKGMSDKIIYRGTTFPIKIDSDKEIQGGIVESENFVTFLPNEGYIKIDPSVLIEGYRPLVSGNDPAFIDIIGVNTHFNSDDTTITADVNSLFDSLTVNSTEDAELTLQSGLTNAGSPYEIEISTDMSSGSGYEEHDPEVVRAKLQINLPYLITAGAGGEMKVAADPGYWVNRNSSISDDINDITWGEDRFVAVADSNQALILEDNQDWQTANTGGLTLDNIIYDNQQGIFIGGSNYGTIAISSTGTSWSHIPTYPEYVESSIDFNNQSVISFDGQYDQLSLVDNPISGSQDRTILMVLKPETDNGTLLEIGSEMGVEAGERWSLVLDEGKLVLEVDDSNRYVSGLELNTDQTYIVGCVLAGNTLGDHQLFVNNDNEMVNGTREIVTVDGSIYIGHQFRDNNSFCGEIAEIILYDRALDTAADGEYEEVRDYLAGKYNIDIVSGTEPDSGDTSLKMWLKADSISGLSDGDALSSWQDQGDADNDLSFADLSINSLASGGDGTDPVLIAVGNRGRILRKISDGQWQSVENPTNAKLDLNDIIWESHLGDNGMFIAVGDADSDASIDATILTSTDGSNWTEKTSNTFLNLNCIGSYYDDQNSTNYLVAAGDAPESGNAVILTSNNGDSWSIQESNISLDLNDITVFEKNNQPNFAIVGDGENPQQAIILKSNDTINWEIVNSGITTDLYGITTRL